MFANYGKNKRVLIITEVHLSDETIFLVLLLQPRESAYILEGTLDPTPLLGRRIVIVLLLTETILLILST